MSTKSKNQPVLDEELLSVFRETFGNDQKLLNEAIQEARRAFSIIKTDEEWQMVELIDNYEC